MRIEHIALWSRNIENLKSFYIKFFGAKSNCKYINKDKDFGSYFLSFDSDARIEIMQIPNLISRDDTNINIIGLAHFAVSVGSREAVDKLTNELRDNGYRILSEPRTTGDGYYESAVADPDGNKVEITI